MSAIGFSDYKEIAINGEEIFNLVLSKEGDAIVIPYIVGAGGTIDVSLSPDCINWVNIPSLQGIAAVAHTPIVIPNPGCYQMVKLTVKIAKITLQISTRSDRQG